MYGVRAMNIKNYRQTSTAGFSLIELMVVIAIVAVLAAVAVPSYKSYIGKGKMAEVNSIIQYNMNKAVENYSNGQSVALTVTSPGSNYITSIVTSAPSSTSIKIVVTMNTSFDTAFTSAPVIAFVGTDTNGVVTWDCTGGTTTKGITPTGAVSTAAQVYFPACN